jgi:putative peptidoglycan lipid II flippase
MAGAGLLNGLATGVSYAREAYALPGLLWLIRLVPLLAFFMIGFPQSQMAWLAIGLGIADWIRGVILLHRPQALFCDPAASNQGSAAQVLLSYSLVLAASVIMGLNPIVDRIIAERCGVGAISILETGERLYGILAGLATMGLMTVLLAQLSKQQQVNADDPAWPAMLKFIRCWILFWLLAGLGAGYWGLDFWLDRLTPLSPVQSQAAKGVYWLYLMGLPAFVLGVAYVKRLQAGAHFNVMVFTSILAVILNIPASLALAAAMGIPGIALATTLIYILNCAVLLGFVRYYRAKDLRVQRTRPSTGA